MVRIFFKLLYHNLFYDSDAAVKQLLILINESEAFIIEDLDDTHLFIDANSVEKLKEKFHLKMEENVYKLGDGIEVKSTW